MICNIESLAIFTVTVIFTTLDNLAFVWLVKSFPSTSFLFVATISAVLLAVVLLIILFVRYLVSKIWFYCVDSNMSTGTYWFTITKHDCQIPKKDHIVIATLDQCCTILAVAGGGTSGQAQISINQSIIPLTLLFSFLGLKRYFNLGQIVGGGGIYVGAILIGIDSSTGHVTGSLNPVLSIILFASSQIPNALAFVLREKLLNEEMKEDKEELIAEGIAEIDECEDPQKNEENVVKQCLVMTHDMKNTIDSTDQLDSYHILQDTENRENNHHQSLFSKHGMISRIVAMATLIAVIRSILAIITVLLIILINKKESEYFFNGFNTLLQPVSWSFNMKLIHQSAGLAIVGSTMVYVLTKVSSLSVAGGDGGAFRATLASSLSLPVSILIFSIFPPSFLKGESNQGISSFLGVLGLVLAVTGLSAYLFFSQKSDNPQQPKKKEKNGSS